MTNSCMCLNTCLCFTMATLYLLGTLRHNLVLICILGSQMSEPMIPNYIALPSPGLLRFLNITSLSDIIVHHNCFISLIIYSLAGLLLYNYRKYLHDSESVIQHCRYNIIINVSILYARPTNPQSRGWLERRKSKSLRAELYYNIKELYH